MRQQSNATNVKSVAENTWIRRAPTNALFYILYYILQLCNILVFIYIM